MTKGRRYLILKEADIVDDEDESLRDSKGTEDESLYDFEGQPGCDDREYYR